MGHLPGDLTSGVYSLGSQVRPQDIEHPAFEPGEQAHVTVLYGLHTTSPVEVYNNLKRHHAVRPASMTFGKLGLFRHRDMDVLKLGVESPDLDHLHDVSKQLPNSFKFPNYNPHVTVAYLKPGTGEKYLNLPNPLQGREVTLGGLVFSDPNKNYSYIPLRAPQVTDAIELCANWGFNENDLIEMTTAMAVGTIDRPFGLNRAIFPSFKAPKLASKRPVKPQPEEATLQSSRKLTEELEVSVPRHIQVMDFLEDRGWIHFDDGPKHRQYLNESFPNAYVDVVRRDEDPQWKIRNQHYENAGSLVADLDTKLGELTSTIKQFSGALAS